MGSTAAARGELPSWNKLMMEDDEDDDHFPDGNARAEYRNEKISTEQTSQGKPAVVAAAAKEAVSKPSDAQPSKGENGDQRKHGETMAAADDDGLKGFQERSGPMMAFPSLFATSNFGNDDMAIFDESDEDE